MQTTLPGKRAHLIATSFTVALFAALLTSASAQSTLASAQLLEIAQTEANIYKQIAEAPDFYSAQDLDRRLNDLLQSYRAYLSEHPDDAHALILYGKLLRRVDQSNQAFTAFLKADELDPEIAVVKQQIGTHLAEMGKGKAALPFYLQAVDLEPQTAAYHYALGQLLYAFKPSFIEDGIFTSDALDREMIKAFRKAASLEPDNSELQMRLGEAFYDLSTPDWNAALLHWNQIRLAPDSSLHREIVDLHRARVLGKLGRIEEASALADTIQQPGLQASRQQVLDEIAQY